MTTPIDTTSVLLYWDEPDTTNGVIIDYIVTMDSVSDVVAGNTFVIEDLGECTYSYNHECDKLCIHTYTHYMHCMHAWVHVVFLLI